MEYIWLLILSALGFLISSYVWYKNNLKKEKFSPHSPRYNFRTSIPINYNKKADCPKIKKFFQDILYEDDFLLIQEWFGYVLYNKYFEKKAVILFGDTNTGKTITLDLISTFIGEANTTSLSLQNISHGKSFDLFTFQATIVCS